MLLHKVHISGQQELPAPVDPGGRHVLQEVFDIVRGKLCRGRRKEELISRVLSERIKKIKLICSLEVKVAESWSRLALNSTGAPTKTTDANATRHINSCVISCVSMTTRTEHNLNVTIQKW